MNITEVRVKLLDNQPDKLRGFASITIDDFIVIRDLPSRKLCDRCPSCGGKNHLRARFCNDCGKRMRSDRGMHDERGRMRLYADISHPIHQKARAFVESCVLEAFKREVERSKQDGYVAHSFEDLDYESYEHGASAQHVE
jgi:stage V sporulation protein G